MNEPKKRFKDMSSSTSSGGKRRTKWQALAARKYSRLYFLGGDGGEYECWVVLTKCPHQQTRHWRYALRSTKAEVEILLTHWHAMGCGSHECRGKAEHLIWRLKDE
jgi:hypothetical protein